MPGCISCAKTQRSLTWQCGFFNQISSWFSNMIKSVYLGMRFSLMPLISICSFFNRAKLYYGETFGGHLNIIINEVIIREEQSLLSDLIILK